ncbi:class II fructose-bisphosphate aldolase [Sporolactobacillus shoreae]|uniref:Class II fructose-bisphosphate aldolase n=1 Tax=Sporolactobacillus shoreae TaxID=1465501 RepID=A0A4Z0GRB6_9BACL|nr:class II fructose-bisphosphate aldolase [Sporolactobacillus shoreae]TGA99890.1 class II fructose-bisphosphate aldolase [Sporolactobacillus shoreae]
MLVNTLELLRKAQEKKYAVAAFNVYNMETIQAAFHAAESEGRPVILALGERYFPMVELDGFSAMVKALAEKTKLPVALHLDHAEQKESIVQAIRCGFTSVMFDGSRFDLKENIAQTKEIAAIAHLTGVSVEGEVGSMKTGDFSDEAEGDGSLTDPQSAGLFARETGIDFLAAAIGTVHGLYKGEPHIDLSLLHAIHQCVPIPLVLHGGSGTPDDVIRKAIRLGITKINVNTEVSIAAVQGMQKTLDSHQWPHLSVITSEAQKSMESVMKKCIRLFSSASED